MSQNGSNLMIYLILFIANLVVSLIYFAILRIELKKNKIINKEEKSKKENDKKSKTEQSSILRLIIMIIVPIVGPLYFFVSWVVFKLFMSKPVDLEDVIFSKERVKFNRQAEEEKERNLVSLEEAVEVTEKDELRNLMMNVVSGDIQKSLSSITRALQSEDTETAHYAASVLQDALNEFRVNIDKNLKKMTDEPGHKIMIAEMLIDYMNAILEQKVFVDMEQKEYVGILDNVADILYTEAKDRITIDQIENVGLRLLEIEDFSNCEKWGSRAADLFSSTLAAYTLRLKLYFKMGRKDEFFDLMDELKASTIVIDKETLELIRVTQKVQQ